MFFHRLRVSFEEKNIAMASKKYKDKLKILLLTIGQPYTDTREVSSCLIEKLAVIVFWISIC